MSVVARDWYSGADQTGQVARIIEDVSRNMDDPDWQPTAGALQALKKAVDLEDEDNWIAFLSGLLGMVFERLDNLEEALVVFRKTIEVARPDRSSFDDILNVYCQSAYHAGRLLLEREQFSEALKHLLYAVPYMNLVFEDAHLCAVTRFVDDCLTALGEHSFALPFAEAAAFYCEGDKATLEFLVEAYKANGLGWKAAAISEERKVNS